MGIIQSLVKVKKIKMKLIGFFAACASAMSMAGHPTFPDSTDLENIFWRQSAAMALNTAQAAGNLNGYGITSIDGIACNRMHTVRNAGGPGEEHVQHCVMTWTSNSWGHVNQCKTKMDITACLMCRRMPFQDNFVTECKQL